MAPTTFVLCYIGPGGMLSAIGSFLALLAALVLAVIGFVWYPVQRLLRAFRRRSQAQKNAPDPRSIDP